jgi:hypothetical protein
MEAAFSAMEFPHAARIKIKKDTNVTARKQVMQVFLGEGAGVIYLPFATHVFAGK